MEKYSSIEDLKIAHRRIKPFIHNTPVLTSESINKMVGSEVFFKCENFQKVGAFKIRGATNAILSLSEAEKKFGVATHSSGNHAQAVALAARQNDIKAYIVMPETASKIKRKAVLEYGAKVITCDSNLKAREETLKQVLNERGAFFIHPYNDINVIKGQATAAIELLNQCPGLNILMAPVGGGGLISGTALAAINFSPQVKVIGGEPKGADDAYNSLRAGKIIEKQNPSSIADGLLATVGIINFDIIQKYVDKIFVVEEEEIIAAMRFIWERMKIIIEPSAAVPVAALFKNKEYLSGYKIGIIISGGNVDLSSLPFK